ncbi:hypothetical protein DFP79_0195, partial [Marinomonas balearica]
MSEKYLVDTISNIPEIMELLKILNDVEL